MFKLNNFISRRARPPAYNSVRTGKGAETFFDEQKFKVRAFRQVRCKKTTSVVSVNSVVTKEAI